MRTNVYLGCLLTVPGGAHELVEHGPHLLRRRHLGGGLGPSQTAAPVVYARNSAGGSGSTTRKRRTTASTGTPTPSGSWTTLRLGSRRDLGQGCLYTIQPRRKRDEDIFKFHSKCLKLYHLLIKISFDIMIIWKWIYIFGFLIITNIKKKRYFLTKGVPHYRRFYDPHTLQSSDSLADWFIVITLVTC